MISLTSPYPPPRAGRTPFGNWESNKNGRFSRVTDPPHAISTRNEPRTPQINLWKIRGKRSRLVLKAGSRYSAGMADRAAQVLEMHRKGFSSLTIGQVLGIDAGEVEKICGQHPPSDGQLTTGDHSTEQGGK